MGKMHFFLLLGTVFCLCFSRDMQSTFGLLVLGLCILTTWMILFRLKQRGFNCVKYRRLKSCGVMCLQDTITAAYKVKSQRWCLCSSYLGLWRSKRIQKEMYKLLLAAALLTMEGINACYLIHCC